MGICKNNRNKKEKNQCNNNVCHKIRSYDVPNLFYDKVDFIYKKTRTSNVSERGKKSKKKLEIKV